MEPRQLDLLHMDTPSPLINFAVSITLSRGPRARRHISEAGKAFPLPKHDVKGNDG